MQDTEMSMVERQGAPSGDTKRKCEHPVRNPNSCPHSSQAEPSIGSHDRHITPCAVFRRVGVLKNWQVESIPLKNAGLRRIRELTNIIEGMSSQSAFTRLASDSMGTFIVALDMIRLIAAKLSTIKESWLYHRSRHLNTCNPGKHLGFRCVAHLKEEAAA